ncbi:MAG: tRNA guanosine(15) transglycosylase TgtA [Ignisphaera sp.]
MREQDLAGRIGRLKTRSGVIETPYLFPVVDPSLQEQYVKPSELMEIGFRGIITNAYLLKKFSPSPIDVHKHLNFDGIVMTDSGAYQILRYGNIEVGNREIIEYQCAIKSDIGVILDIPTRFDASRDEAFNSANETLKRAQEAINIISDPLCRETLWTLPIQGGVHLDILHEHAKKSVDVFYDGFSIFALGSPTTLLEQYMFDKIAEMIYTVRSEIPFATPLHLFGAGHPLIIPFAVALGVDLFDSASYILYAKDDRYITRRGTYKLKNIDYSVCQCPICSKYSPKDLLELPKRERIRLLSLHNLYVIREEINEVKQAIKENRLWEYLEYKANSHPAAKRIFIAMLKYLEYIYRHSPRSRPNARAVFILSEYSIYNPKIINSRRRSILMKNEGKENILVFLPYSLTEDSKIENLLTHVSKEMNADPQTLKLYLYYPIIGVIPIELHSVYPYSHFELGSIPTGIVISDLAYLIFEILVKSSNVKETWIITCKEGWQEKLYERIARIIKNSNIRVEVKKIVFTC